ncbi:hypothetical protein TBLA_0C00400 [Henningerozyma blattae CBS 6284]|uniref:Mediator of RNA polymerase II transcription subunit 14 n=1 Tax=Henningerozyma blattae (strain ATCC 34711 / CBS 6284 / DSM 70876 / NBRC 10599 / NRRL Y-10934 / UCD 77-7) TaxID=1071380 RepID=I2H0F4_HENB6|nr:hypothetical protein TBLA_0C00400 [Tetrapisispora blattae CBS 6284]CCH59856.1 hypothetical protein TBLA_0C00400 [Tetrapisispora blattae CBS 6284]
MSTKLDSTGKSATATATSPVNNASSFTNGKDLAIQNQHQNNDHGTSNNISSSEYTDKTSNLDDTKEYLNQQHKNIDNHAVIENHYSDGKDKSPTNDNMGEILNNPPEIQHVEINQLPLSKIIRNLTVYTIKEISQYMKTNNHTNGPTSSATSANGSGDMNSSSSRKIRFLKLIIFLRNQFLKLYVLIKWCKTIKNNNFNIMIDLLNWFRSTNLTVNNCIWLLKNNITNMNNAKLPNVDLVTSLEVLSLGKPNFSSNSTRQTYDNNSSSNLLSLDTSIIDKNIKIPPDLILNKLHDLNILISTKLALMNIPEQFNNYIIKDGRVYITAKNEFEIQLATIDRKSPLFFVDLKLNFFNNNQIFIPINKIKFEKIINEILFKSKNPLFALYKFLHKYIISLQLFLIHNELLILENDGKFNGGNLVHRYDSKKNIISIRYWLNVHMGNKGKIIIGIDRKSDNLILKWDHDIAKNSRLPTNYFDILTNLESVLDEIMFNHAHLIRAELLSKGIFQEDEENSDVLLFQMPTTCLSVAPIQLKIDLKSGVFYFKNPTSLLQLYTKKINMANTAEELTTVLQNLKLDKIKQVLRNMFEKTGWVCSSAVKLDKPIQTKFNIINTYNNNSSSSNNNNNKAKQDGSPARTNNEVEKYTLLQDDIFICLPSWPAHWYLILTIISSNTSCVIEKRVGKVMSVNGKWQIVYMDDSNVNPVKLETMTYKKIMHLQKSILRKIINHMIIDSLNQLKISNKICSSEKILSILPDYISVTSKPTPGTTSSAIVNSSTVTSNITPTQIPHNNDYSPIIALELNSFLDGSVASNTALESSMFLRIDYSTSEIKLFGRFKRDIMSLKCRCDELMINLVKTDPLAFYLGKKFSNLNFIVQYLTEFKQKLFQLVVVTDVVERLHKNFASDTFEIVALKPNEISFKYLKDGLDSNDCTIQIQDKDKIMEKLSITLSPSNPQHIIQPFIENEKMDYHFVFNYLQFTSSLFATLQQIVTNNQTKLEESQTIVSFGLHNLYSYQIIFFLPPINKTFNILVDLKNVSHNEYCKMKYYIHFSKKEENLAIKSPGYSLVRKIQKNIFSLDTINKDNIKKYPTAIRLSAGICCDSEDVEFILKDITKIFDNYDSVDTPTGGSTGGIPTPALTAAM